MRAAEDGRAPPEVRVSVAGGARVKVEGKLVSIAAMGKLRVEEASGPGLEVLLDGASVGRTPWGGAVPAGPQVVLLRGPAQTGSLPVDARVRADETKALRISATRLHASLRVEADAGALVTLDGVAVGEAPFEARVPSGKHRVEVHFAGKPAWESDVTLGADEARTLRASSNKADTFARFVLDATAGFGVATSLGRDLSATCAAPCKRGVPVVALVRGAVGYRLTPALTTGVEIGYVGAGQSLSNRSDVLLPNGRPPASGTVTDDLRLRAILLGGFVSLQHAERFGWQARLGLGVAPTPVRDARRVAVMVQAPTRSAAREQTRDEVLLSTGDLAGHPPATLSGTTVAFTPTVGVAFTP